MMLKVLLRAFLIWLVLIGVETVHGILRTLLLVPLLGDFPSRQVGVLVGSVLIFGVAYVFIRWLRAGTTAQLMAVGLLWVVLTILFEIGLGRLILDLPWDRLVEDYDLTRGGFMTLGLLFMAAAPWLALKLRKVSKHAPNQNDVIKIELPVSHSESVRPATEVLEVIRLNPHRFKLLFSPGVVEGVAKGDVIELSQTDPQGFTVVTRSGQLCVWFYFREQGRNRGPDGDRVRAAVEKFGGVCDGGGNTHLVFSVPVSLGFPAVEALLNDLVAQHSGSSWLFGNVYDPWNDFKPLGWWEESDSAST